VEDQLKKKPANEIAEALWGTLHSPNEVDPIGSLQTSWTRSGTLPGPQTDLLRDYGARSPRPRCQGGTVASLTEAIMGLTAG